MADTYQDFEVMSSVPGGGTLSLSVTLEAVSSEHFTVQLDGAEFLAFAVTGSSGAYTVVCAGPLSSGAGLRVLRTTPSTKAGRVVVFTDGAALDQDALNTAYLQLLYIIQEQAESADRSMPWVPSS